MEARHTKELLDRLLGFCLLDEQRVHSNAKPYPKFYLE